LRIFPISDIHLDVNKKDDRIDIDMLPDADVCVVTGDVSCKLSQTYKYLKKLSKKYNNVVYTLGNHEYWGKSFKYTEYWIKSMNNKKYVENIHMLNRDYIMIDGVKFVGCTLWFPNDMMNSVYMDEWIDFQSIPGLAESVYGINGGNRHYLMKNTDETSIVLTHHLPSYHSVYSAYTLSPMNRFFVDNYGEYIIKKKKPQVWIHGHTHFPMDYRYEGTRIICNPIGYFGKEGMRADLEKVIDI